MHAAVLRYLDQVARHGSIRRAAAVLNVASSAVNRQVLKLERELGAALFVRRRDGVGLTPAGEALLRHVRETLDRYERARGDIDGLRGIVTGEVRIASLDSMLVQFVPQVMGAVAASHPLLSFAVMALGPRDIAEELRNGRADIGITFVDPRDRSVEVLDRIAAPLGIVVRPDHPLARRRNIRLRDCAEHPAILVHDRQPMMPAIEAELAAHRMNLKTRSTSNSLEFMRAMLLAGVGVGFFTRFGFLSQIARGELRHVPLAEPRLKQLQIGIMVGRRRVPAPAVSVVLQAMRERLAVFARS
jgi:DNA-binding transcriptional LysR family regulator